LLERLTQEKREAIADKLIAMAADGNIQAIKLLYAYTIGKPTAAPDPDQLDVQEWSHWKSTANLMFDLPTMLRCMMPEVLLELVRRTRPIGSADLAKTMGQAMADPESVLPPTPELVMARTNEPLKRPRKDTLDLAGLRLNQEALAAAAAKERRGSTPPAEDP